MVGEGGESGFPPCFFKLKSERKVRKMTQEEKRDVMYIARDIFLELIRQKKNILIEKRLTFLIIVKNVKEGYDFLGKEEE